MIAQFAALLITGISLMWWLIPRHEITAGFFRIQLMVTLGLASLYVLSAGRFQPDAETSLTVGRVAGIAIGVAAYLGSIFWHLGRRPQGTFFSLAIFPLAVIALIATTPQSGSPSLFPQVLLACSQLSTAACLGGMVTGMLLGHWYLTAPTMSIRPLQRLVVILLGFLIVRAGVSLWAGIAYYGFLHDSVHWTWYALRWLAGIVIPLILAVMTIQILRLRNTQAATGVLFAGVILTFIGEMSATLLLAELKVPL